ncbi:hypothetical protein JRQ81_012710 [Phrynocephalus forsythii]|uniref:Uncharacterized protein n=1 Tax=Phrynocephalus forsythii TaxID=171643 RepID=A0A9Q0Y2Q6_9SAUR|nr:hypothetical protein JRQ81_012710 [Phrynocephalus forsythii]
MLKAPKPKHLPLPFETGQMVRRKAAASNGNPTARWPSQEPRSKRWRRVLRTDDPEDEGPSTPPQLEVPTAKGRRREEEAEGSFARCRPLRNWAPFIRVGSSPEERICRRDEDSKPFPSP